MNDLAPQLFVYGLLVIVILYLLLAARYFYYWSEERRIKWHGLTGDEITRLSNTPQPVIAKLDISHKGYTIRIQDNKVIIREPDDSLFKQIELSKIHSVESTRPGTLGISLEPKFLTTDALNGGIFLAFVKKSPSGGGLPFKWMKPITKNFLEADKRALAYYSRLKAYSIKNKE